MDALGVVPVADVPSILGLVRRWVALLSRRDFAGAASYLTPVPDAGVVYTADLIKHALGLYSWKYRETSTPDREKYLPNVSDPDMIDCEHENLMLYTKTKYGVAYLEYDLPIEGAWSDLTAIFYLLPVAGGFGLGLHDLHVL